MTARSGWKPGDRLPAGRAEESFVDKAPLYSPGGARAEADRCLFCFDAPCIQACPTEIDVPKFIKRIATGDVLGSAQTILEANLLGYSCGRVCPVEVLCAGACVYNHLEQPPIEIGRLQRYAVESAWQMGRPLLHPKPRRSGRVAHVGAGPASLSCAGVLALEGVETVVYESRLWPGGLNTTGVAPYKMMAPEALAEVAFVSSLGVQLETGVTVGREIDADQLLREYDAVFLGLGLGSDRRLGVPGEEGDGVEGAVEFIERMKVAPRKGGRAGGGADFGRVLVVGGGNTAIDAARELAQLGARSVVMVYRRSVAEMSGYAHELDPARTEGVQVVERALPVAVIREAGRVRALRVQRAGVAGPTEEDLPADLIVVAIGQDRLAATASLFPGVEVDDRGRVVVDSATGRTGHPKVYSGGDCANGGKEVVNAVAEGKLAAAAILRAISARA